jgi:hypothetical protein
LRELRTTELYSTKRFSKYGYFHIFECDVDWLPNTTATILEGGYCNTIDFKRHGLTPEIKQNGTTALKKTPKAINNLSPAVATHASFKGKASIVSKPFPQFAKRRCHRMA